MSEKNKSNETLKKIKEAAFPAKLEIDTDCYSEGDRGFMKWGQEIRAKLFYPLLYLLNKAGCTPNILTYLSLLVGFIACFVFQYSHFWALVLIALHVFLDGMDGPLARYQKTSSSRGSFTDTMVDQIIIVATTITLIHLGVIHVIAGGVYIFSYTMVIVFSMVRNALGIPYSWLLRPRFMIYLWLIVEFYYWPGSINYLLWIFNCLLIFKVGTGFYKIRARM